MEENQKNKLLWYFSMTFVVLLVLSNTIANRLITIGSLLLPSAIIIFPATYILGDVITEIFGFKTMRTLIITSLLLNCVFVGLGLIAVSLPAPSNAENIGSYSEVFSVAPRIVLASISGYFVGAITNAFIMDRMKKNVICQSLFVRIFASTVAGEFLDTCLFISIAFFGLLHIKMIIGMIVIQFIIKITYETLFSPLTLTIIKKINKQNTRQSSSKMLTKT